MGWEKNDLFLLFHLSNYNFWVLEYSISILDLLAFDSQ